MEDGPLNQMEWFLAGWERVRQNVLRVAEDMPEEHYGYSLFEETRTFHEQIQHILHNADVFVDCALNGQFTRALFDLYPYQGFTRTALLDALRNNLRNQSDLLRAQGEAIAASTIRYLDGSERPALEDRKSTRLNSSHIPLSRMPSSA